MNTIDEVTWQDVWNVCFPPALKPVDVAAMDYVLRSTPNLTGEELRRAVVTLAESGRYDPFKSKPGQLKAEVFRNRPHVVEDPYAVQYEAACEKMSKCDSPDGRWDILCESLPNGPDAIELAERLERFGKTLPGGITRREDEARELKRTVDKLQKEMVGA